eukprot:5379205-Prymnesium_polylepis.1
MLRAAARDRALSPARGRLLLRPLVLSLPLSGSESPPVGASDGGSDGGGVAASVDGDGDGERDTADERRRLRRRRRSAAAR